MQTLRALGVFWIMRQEFHLIGGRIPGSAISEHSRAKEPSVHLPLQERSRTKQTPPSHAAASATIAGTFAWVLAHV
jgi:hypothetical protein